MKQLTLLFSVGMLLCLFSCAPAKEGPKAEDMNLANPYKAMMVRHSVSSYDTFKTVFNSKDSLRSAAAMEVLAYGRGIDEPNTIIVLSKLGDLQKAKDLAASPALKDAMMKSTATGAPTIDFMTVIRDDTSKISTMDRIMVSHHVKDFDAWLKVYDAEGKAKRAENGLVDRGMGRGIDDPNMVYLLFAVTDAAKAKARSESEELKKLMTDGGVDSAPAFFSFKWDVMN
ncbi:MAG TPA: hypothetical protein VFG10_15555 [Saprospiraceae bacterium]|nr:hypothetical protein [Saprospiraceae bacterium]